MSERWKSQKRMWPCTLWLFSLMFGLSYFATNVVGISTVHAASRQNNADIPVTICDIFGSAITPGTLAYALDAASSNATTINFGCSSDATFTVPTTISIAEDVTITGQTNHTITLSGGATRQIINVSGSNTLTLNNLTFSNGSGS